MANLPLGVRVAVRDLFEKEYKTLAKKFEDTLLDQYELIVNWQEVNAKQKEKYKGSEMVRNVMRYFASAASSIDSATARNAELGDELIGATYEKKIIFEIVESVEGRDPTTVFENGIMYLRTTLQNFGDDVDKVASNIEQSLGLKVTTPEPENRQNILPKAVSTQKSQKQYAIIRLNRFTARQDDILSIDGPDELLRELKDWLRRNMLPGDHAFTDKAQFEVRASLCQSELIVQSVGVIRLGNFSIASILTVMDKLGYHLEQMQCHPTMEMYILGTQIDSR
ncbi:2401_t:CDS:2 [Paraglomus brasilianum]|uniref:2401_t:CDS:1 n=1 Tax=Paraglomus brasilianum TaxID=144538 RepID=A0A9N9F9R8_9GLOM|nr:2401_t:CDS:2 [Paraglomus brasilianum]